MTISTLYVQLNDFKTRLCFYNFNILTNEMKRLALCIIWLLLLFKLVKDCLILLLLPQNGKLGSRFLALFDTFTSIT